MKYLVISQPENGDAEVVWELNQTTEGTAKEEAQRIANRRSEDVLLVTHFIRIKDQS
jgi:hypothetical protein